MLLFNLFGFLGWFPFRQWLRCSAILGELKKFELINDLEGF